MTESSQHSILRMVALREKLQVSKATVYAWMDPKAKNHNPDFPLPIRLGPSTVGWLAGEIDAFLLKRMEARDKGRARK